MQRTVLLVLTVLILIVPAFAQTQSSNPEPGVARDLALWRAARYSDIRYSLRLEISRGAELLKGEEDIRVTLNRNAEPLVVDWRTSGRNEDKTRGRLWDLRINGHETNDARQVNDHLIVPPTYLLKGQNVIHFRFESPIATSGSAVTRYIDREDNSEYVYTLFVPSDASTIFPCFDQPDLKARFTFEATTPADWIVVSNTSAEREGVTDASSTKRTSFLETQPISTYLFAFATGPFKEFDGPERIQSKKATAYPPLKSEDAIYNLLHDSTPLRVFVRKSKTERAKKEMAEIFRLNRSALDYFAAYFDFKFPFPKYDLVIIPEFAYGGMEHAGATFLREESILFPTDPTSNDLLSRAEVMFHEAAHQWFGDLVTMRWFDDLWLKEGFAEFMAYKAIEVVMPEYSAWKVFYQRIKPAAYLTDITKGTTPIFQEIRNLSAAKSAYGNIVYRKAPSMLRQAEFFLGPDQFRAAIRIYLKEHSYGNAEWRDLVRAFERASGKHLDDWAAAWVKHRGMPDVRASWTVDEYGRINQFSLNEDDVLHEGGSWPIRMRVLLAYESMPPQIITVVLNGAGETAVPDAIGKPRPAFVFPNYEDYGYGRVLLDDKSKRYVLAHLGAVHDDFLRALLWGSLWDSVREAELSPEQYLQLGIELVSDEPDEVSAQSILGRMSTVFNRYISAPQRESIASRLEHLISYRMIEAQTVGLRITYFRAFVAIAATVEARALLKRIFKGDVKIPGMTLRTRDRFDIITALLARNDAAAAGLLNEQAALETSDDAKRYAFAAGAARASDSTKRSYFDAYSGEAKLPESWIEASLVPFNSIEQSALTYPYLKPALAQLPRIKKTRKIFFVNDWLSAFVGGQCSPAALTTVKAFVSTERSLDRDLRLKVLEVEDGLERCVHIRQKFAGL